MKKIRWLHISDLHFNYSDDETECMRETLIPFLNSLGLSIDYIFCTGDIRYRAQP